MGDATKREAQHLSSISINMGIAQGCVLKALTLLRLCDLQQHSADYTVAAVDKVLSFLT